MSKHPFRLAIDGGNPAEDLARLIAPDAVIYPPTLTKPVRAAENVVRILAAAAKDAAPIEYEYELSDGTQTFLIWKGKRAGSNSRRPRSSPRTSRG
jgi:hypothetical protein